MTPRTSFPPSQRRDQILDAARDLFASKGFHATTIEDLMAACGIAKGTLYYHFSGKDEVLEALVIRTTEQMAARAEAAADTPGTALDRLLAAVAAIRAQGPEAAIAADMNAQRNAVFHQLSVVEAVRRIGPVLARIVEDGRDAGEFATDDPLTTAEIILTLGGVLLDPGIFAGEEDQLPRRTVGMMTVAARLLGCDDEALATAAERLR